MASPVCIETMLFYYYSAAEHPRANTSSVINTTSNLRDEGMIEPEMFEGKIVFRPTEKGRAWVEALCSVPFPVAQWVIPPS
ncbi:DNA-binding PadR family transcriptional regulator [Beijerinckia sp. GAS462]|nr:DNA-binding PadR family transcriptional regulator [Beijerinckia sp. GAS462]SEC42415.1 hypothetical protein SAMN05443249_2658 [Beijerinckia sp. 28-YEA-48]